MRRSTTRVRALVAGLAAFVLALPSSSRAAPADRPARDQPAILEEGRVGASLSALPALQALAPSEILASGLGAPTGVAVASDGRVFVTDEKRGQLLELVPAGAGRPRVLTDRLEKPTGVVWEGPDHLLLLAEGFAPPRKPGDDDHRRGPAPRGVLLQVDLASGSLTVLAEGLKHPRGLARAEDGTLYVSADGLWGASEGDARDEHEAEAGEEQAEADGAEHADSFPGTILRWTPATGLTVVVQGFKRPDGLVVLAEGALLVAAEGYRNGGQRLHGSVFVVGATRAVTVRLAERLKRPAGLARDDLGAFVLSAERSGPARGDAPGVLLKLPAQGPAGEFATGLDRPRGLAFGREGHLLVADAEAGLVARFRAPQPPALSLASPVVTNRNPLRLTGTTEAGTRIVVLGGREPAVGTTGADGAFQVEVPLRPNQAQGLQVYAVGAAGQGLVSAPAPLTVLHDDLPPTIAATPDRPATAAGWYSAEVTIGFACADTGSGVASCPPPIVVSTEGANQVISGTAVDVAGNSASASVTLNLDKTPPVVTPTVTPAPNATGWTRADTTVSFAATDALSGVASVPAPATVTTEGANQLVTGTATDLAGNTATASVAVSLDRTPPVITPVVLPPPNAAGWNNTDVTVRFTAMDALAGIASVTPPVTLATEGRDQVVTGTAIDQAGNQATATVTVSLDQTPPVVALTSPPNLSLFSAGPVAVSGTVDDPGATVQVNGVTAAVGAGAFTAPQVPLREGRTVLTAAATDQAGNVGTSSLAVTLDTTPPTVRIDTPSDRAILTTPQVTVTGMINDVVSGTVNAEQATVTVNGVSSTIVNRSFLVPDLLLVRGTNTITAVARDQVGNESQTQIQVTVQEAIGQPRLERVSGNTQSGVIGSTLPEPLVVRLLDPEGRALPGRPVTFTVIRTDGVVRALPEEGRAVTVPTDALGQARVLWQLGTRTGAGNNQVAVTSPGVVGEVVFSASATLGPATQINVVSGEAQRGLVGAPLPLPLVAIVFDKGGNPVGGVPVTFTVEQGGGTLDGSPATTVTKLTDSDGKAAVVFTLGQQEGITNHVVTAGFEGLTGAKAVFVASGVVPGPPQDTRISGVVLDNVDRPIPNATAKIVGYDLSAITNAQGQFTIPGAPVGTITLIVDGSTSTRPETFPFLAFLMTILAGQDNTIGMPIYIPPLDTENSKIVGGGEDVVLTMTGVPGVAFTVFPHSATFPDGSTVGRMMLSQVHADKVPMPPPNGTAPRVVWTLQPAGVHFDPPIRVQLPNTDGLPAGQVVELFQFDHDLEQFVSVGAARVSEDGSVIVSDAGFGITKSGWGAGPPPPPPTKCVGSCDDRNACTNDKCENGVCAHIPLADGTSCDPLNKCTVRATCQGGRCIGDKIEVTILTAPKAVCANRTNKATATVSPGPRMLNWKSTATNILSVTSNNGLCATIKGVVPGTSKIIAEDATTACSSEARTIDVIDISQFQSPMNEVDFCVGQVLDPNSKFGSACVAGAVISRKVFVWSLDPSTFPQSGEGSRGDAARHARWACELFSSPLTKGAAETILRLHENDPTASCESHEQDINNNEVGRQNAAASLNCEQAALEALLEGRLQVNLERPAGGVTCP